MNLRLSDFAWLFAAKGMRAPLGMLLTSLMARVLGPEGLGTWTMLVAVGTLLHSVLLNWTQVITQRFGRIEWLQGGRLDETWSSRWPLIATGLTVAVALVAFHPGDWLKRMYRLEENALWLVVPILAGLWLAAECQGLLQVTGRFARLSLAPVAADIFLMLVLVAAWCVNSLAVARIPLTGLLTGLASAGVLFWGIATIIEWRKMKLRWLCVHEVKIRDSLIYAWPLIPGFLIGYVSDWGDQILIRQFFTEREVGLFQVSYQYLLLLVGLAAPIATVILPQLAGNALNDENAVKRYVEHMAPLAVVLWLPFALILVAVMPAVFTWLLGPHFSESGLIFRVLLAAVPGSIFGHVYGVPYTVQGRLGRSTVLYGGLMSLANLGISLALLPSFGAIGAAIATSVSYLLIQALYFADQTRTCNTPSGSAGLALVLAHGFGIVQAMLPDILPRFALAMVTCVLVVLVARSGEVVNPDVLARLFSHRLAPLGRLLLLIYSGPRSPKSS